jgi:hypothetical protein
MATDWQVGDLAVCVEDQPLPGTVSTGATIRKGAVYRVVGLKEHRGDLNLFLHGITYRLGIGTRAFRFRKIRPDEQEACEPEFVTLLKRAKRPVSA